MLKTKQKRLGRLDSEKPVGLKKRRKACLPFFVAKLSCYLKKEKKFA